MFCAISASCEDAVTDHEALRPQDFCVLLAMRDAWASVFGNDDCVAQMDRMIRIPDDGEDAASLFGQATQFDKIDYTTAIVAWFKRVIECCRLGQSDEAVAAQEEYEKLFMLYASFHGEPSGEIRRRLNEALERRLAEKVDPYDVQG